MCSQSSKISPDTGLLGDTGYSDYDSSLDTLMEKIEDDGRQK